MDVTITDSFVFFWRGWPSQWFKSPFTIDEIQYRCPEQFMMAEKARIFGDAEIERQILATASPKHQKALGRQIRNFDESIWNARCRGVVYRANLAKFQQNAGLQKELLATQNRTIVEASPVDFIWGIGMAVDNPLIEQPDEWPGKNWLGIALMQVRATLAKPAEPMDAELQRQLAARNDDV